MVVTTPQSPCPKPDAISDRFQIDSRIILAPQMGAKSRSEGCSDQLPDVHQSQNQKNKFLTRFPLASSTLRSCNLTVKTEVFFNIFTSPLLSLWLTILPFGAFKKIIKLVPKGFQTPSQTLFEVTSVLETLLGRVRNDFGFPNGSPRKVLEAPSRH